LSIQELLLELVGAIALLLELVGAIAQDRVEEIVHDRVEGS
jgi:hypothetical protein